MRREELKAEGRGERNEEKRASGRKIRAKDVVIGERKR